MSNFSLTVFNLLLTVIIPLAKTLLFSLFSSICSCVMVAFFVVAALSLIMRISFNKNFFMLLKYALVLGLFSFQSLTAFDRSACFDTPYTTWKLILGDPGLALSCLRVACPFCNFSKNLEVPRLGYIWCRGF